jgi:hypothetical protein
MPKKAFFSFHYAPDNWRVSQIRNIGAIEGNPTVTDNDWETVKRGGDLGIQNWIDNQISGKSCGIVMIGSNTKGRKWINYEIAKLWNEGKGVLGIYIHNLKDSSGNQSLKGQNPFDEITLNNGATRISSVVKTYDPPYSTSTYVYDHIKENIENWINESLAIRAKY